MIETLGTAVVTMLMFTSSPLIAQTSSDRAYADLDGSGSRFLIEVCKDTDEDDSYVVRVTRLRPEPVIVDEYEATACYRPPSAALVHLSDSKRTQIDVSCTVGNRGLLWTSFLEWHEDHLVLLNADELVEATVEDLDGDGIDEILEQRLREEKDWDPFIPSYRLYRLAKGADTLQPAGTIPLLWRYAWGAGEEESDVKPFTARPGRYKLIVRNGTTLPRVDNAVIMLNGVTVAGDKAFAKKPETITRHVTLRHSNRLRVVVKTPTACAMNVVLVSEPVQP
jgi:hypothetical protein